MVNMERTVREIKARHPEAVILVGGAPVTREFCEKIGASHYSPDPQGAVSYLNSAVVAA
jgi:methanogenic corrinoid protein MtbC1